ncbi:hypothetical protein COCNU_03G006540 [Cocos nucifera]|uniref:UBL3-like ubiquitin domain-containing protein n=1 Tax=Cocos nucifera TaxID=13894 RepID=A0A8K0I3C2_COCNU|nr:hypothetical protein COCNU_03G006540 [Cocos nucifera]
MAQDDSIELKFRLFDGSDIGPDKYDPSTTVASLKEVILARWPQEEHALIAAIHPFDTFHHLLLFLFTAILRYRWIYGFIELLKEFITDTGLMHHKSSMLSSIPLFYLVVLEGSFSDPKMVKQDKEITPKTINDVKLINAGKILENNQTLAESRVPVGELPGGVITMHVVVRPPQLDKNNGIALLFL